MLTATQQLDVRRYCGYPSTVTAYFGGDPVVVQITGRTLTNWFSEIGAAEETVLTDIYLANLKTLEVAVLEAQDNIDTSSAGSWTANPTEINDRIRLYNKWRKDLCAFIGLTPGPGLSSGLTIVRA